jgi:thiosulfate/3-mercaptopyruvate sulfurtransferase
MFTTFVSTETLAQHLNDPNWIILDTRFDLMQPAAGRQAYNAAHIPGAHFLDLNEDLADPSHAGAGRHPLPDAQRFAAKLSALGVDRSKQVVVYDGGSMMFVGRAWWMLRWLGHDAVCGLDGGYAAWENERRAVSSQAPVPLPSNFAPSIRDHTQVATEVVLSGLAQRAHLLIDARSPERYRGDVEPIDPVAGHIPGAQNRPFGRNLGTNGKLLPVEQLRAQFNDLLAGRAPSKVVHTCGSGVSSIANMMAMEHAGLNGSRLYVGSWSAWSADASRPMAKGG